MLSARFGSCRPRSVLGSLPTTPVLFLGLTTFTRRRLDGRSLLVSGFTGSLTVRFTRSHTVRAFLRVRFLQSRASLPSAQRFLFGDYSGDDITTKPNHAPASSPAIALPPSSDYGRTSRLQSSVLAGRVVVIYVRQRLRQRFRSVTCSA